MPKGLKVGGRDWKPGQSGNPKGPTPIPPEIKEARKLNRMEFERILNQYLHATVDEIKAAAADPKTTTIEQIVLRILVEGIKKGDERRLGFLLDRLLGPVKQVVNHETDGQSGFKIVIDNYIAKRKQIEGE